MTDPDRAPSTAEQPKICEVARDACRICRGVASPRVVDSTELLQGQREVFIIHKGQVYRLLRTRNDKLILQK